MIAIFLLTIDNEPVTLGIGRICAEEFCISISGVAKKSRFLYGLAGYTLPRLVNPSGHRMKI